MPEHHHNPAMGDSKAVMLLDRLAGVVDSFDFLEHMAIEHMAIELEDSSTMKK